MAFKTYEEITSAIINAHDGSEGYESSCDKVNDLFKQYRHKVGDLPRTRVLFSEIVFLEIAAAVHDVCSGKSLWEFPGITKIYTGKCRRKPHRHVTVVEFSDGSQIKVTQHKGEKHDPEKAVLFAIVKKLYGVGEGGFHSVMKNALKLMEGER